MTWTTLTDLISRPLEGRQVADGWAHPEFCRQAQRLAACLQARGVKQVAVSMADAAELALVMLAAWRARVVVVLPADLLHESLVALAPQVDLLLIDSDTQTDGHAQQALALGLPCMHWNELPVAWPPCGADRGLGDDGMDIGGFAEDEPALIVRTSGSSGQPKAIVKTIGQLQREIEVLEALWGERAGASRVVGSVGVHHIYGLTFRVLWPLMAGRVIGRRQIAFTEDLLAAGGQEPVVWIGSPALYKRMTDEMAWPQAAGRVRLVFSAGGPLPGQASARLHQHLHAWPIEIYGSTETGAAAWRVAQQAWQTLPGVSVGVGPSVAPVDPADPVDVLAGAGESAGEAGGTLWIRSPWLPAGHVERTADSAQCVEGGFVLGERLDRIVKLEDKRVSLARIEAALATHAWVDDVRCGVYQAGRAQVGCLVVPSALGLHVLRNQGRSALTQGLAQHLKDHVEAIALPRRWRLLRALPWSAQGKLPQTLVNTLLTQARPHQPDIVSRNQEPDGSWRLELVVPTDLAVFAGHFPQAPVVPGVVQIEWAQALGCELHGLAAEAREFEVLKFQRLMRPGDAVTLSVSLKRGKLYFAFGGAQGDFSSGRIVVTSPEAAAAEGCHA